MTLCHNGYDGIKAFKEGKFDIVLLDIILPDITGLEVFKEIKAMSNIPVLFISAKTEEVDRLLGFALGADDYITKPFSPREVVYRVKARLKNSESKVNESGVFKFDDIVIDKRAWTVTKSGIIQNCTHKEFKLLTYLIENENRVLSKEQICRAVWGEEYFCSDNTISVHIRKIRTKIEDDPSKPRYIQTVIGLGYKFVF